MDKPALLVCFERATEAMENEDWAAARRAFLDGIELEPNLPLFLLYAAGVEARLGDEAASRGHLDKAARLGAAADLAADPAFAEVIDQPEFRELARRLLTNGEPHPGAEIVHRFADAELWPEGIARDDATGDLYVGSIHRRAIFRIRPDGEVHELGTSSSDGLLEVLGLSVDSRRRALWAATGDGDYREPFEGPPRRNELVRYDLETGLLEARYSVPDDTPRLLNDVAVGTDGTAWATDSLRAELYRVSPGGEIELFDRYPELVFLNGLAISRDGRMLYLGHYGGTSVVSVNDGSIRPLNGPAMTLGMVDGMSWTDNRLVLVQNSRHVNFRVVRVDLGPDGLTAESLVVLPSGLPDGLLPYTCAVSDDEVFVVAAAEFQLMDEGKVPPAPVVVRFPLSPASTAD